MRDGLIATTVRAGRGGARCRLRAATCAAGAAALLAGGPAAAQTLDLGTPMGEDRGGSVALRDFATVLEREAEALERRYLPEAEPGAALDSAAARTALGVAVRRLAARTLEAARQSGAEPGVGLVGLTLAYRAGAFEALDASPLAMADAAARLDAIQPRPDDAEGVWSALRAALLGLAGEGPTGRPLDSAPEVTLRDLLRRAAAAPVLEPWAVRAAAARGRAQSLREPPRWVPDDLAESLTEGLDEAEALLQDPSGADRAAEAIDRLAAAAELVALADSLRAGRVRGDPVGDLQDLVIDWLRSLGGDDVDAMDPMGFNPGGEAGQRRAARGVLALSALLEPLNQQVGGVPVGEMDEEVVRELRTPARLLSQRFVELRGRVLASLPGAMSQRDPLTDPAVLAVLGSSREAAESAAGLVALSRYLQGATLTEAATLAPIGERPRVAEAREDDAETISVWSRNAVRHGLEHVDAERLLSLGRAVYRFGRLPLEDRLERDPGFTEALLGVVDDPAGVTAVLDRARQDLLGSWDGEGDEQAAAAAAAIETLVLGSRVCALLESAAGAALVAREPALANGFAGFEVEAGQLAGAAEAAVRAARVAAAAFARGDGDAAAAAVRDAERAGALGLLAGEIVWALSGGAASTGVSELASGPVVAPAPGLPASVLAGAAAEIAEACLLAAEARAAASDAAERRAAEAAARALDAVRALPPRAGR